MSTLGFADDIVLFANTGDTLQQLLEELNTEAKKDGTKMNKKKTKIMCNEVAKKRPRTGITIAGEKMEIQIPWKNVNAQEWDECWGQPVDNIRMEEI